MIGILSAIAGTYVLSEFTSKIEQKKEIAYGDTFYITEETISSTFQNYKDFVKLEYPKSVSVNEIVLLKAFSKSENVKYLWDISYEGVNELLSIENNVELSLNKKGNYHILLYIQDINGDTATLKLTYSTKVIK